MRFLRTGILAGLAAGAAFPVAAQRLAHHLPMHAVAWARDTTPRGTVPRRATAGGPVGGAIVGSLAGTFAGALALSVACGGDVFECDDTSARVGTVLFFATQSGGTALGAHLGNHSGGNLLLDFGVALFVATAGATIAESTDRDIILVATAVAQIAATVAIERRAATPAAP